MRQYLNEYDIANDIRLRRAAHPGTFLLVEGDTDRRFYASLMHPQHCKIVIGNNKNLVFKVLGILEQAGFPGILAIVDADFMRVSGDIPPSPNILLCDTHDLEMLLIASPALEKFLDEYASEEKLRRFTERRQTTIRQVLLELGMPLGYLRWASLIQGWALVFEDTACEKFIDRDNLEFDESKMLNYIRAHSKIQNLDVSTMKTVYLSLHQTQQHPLEICCGHDVVAILSLALRKVLGTHNTRDLLPEITEKNLRLAYENRFFATSQIYTLIQQWENANQPYVVLA